MKIATEQELLAQLEKLDTRNKDELIRNLEDRKSARNYRYPPCHIDKMI